MAKRRRLRGTPLSRRSISGVPNQLLKAFERDDGSLVDDLIRRRPAWSRFLPVMSSHPSVDEPIRWHLEYLEQYGPSPPPAPKALWSDWDDYEALAALIRRHPHWRPLLGEPLRSAAPAGAIDAARCFLDHGADVNSPNELGERPLGFACAYDHFTVARLLVERGADVNYLDKDGFRPLDAAFSGSRPAFRDWLISLGAEREGDSEGAPYDPTIHDVHCPEYCVERTS